MQVCTIVCGNTASIASGKPFSPSQQMMNASATPRFLSSVITFSQNFAPSVVSIHMPQHFLLALEADAQRQVHVLVLHLPLLADLQHDRVQVDHRPDRIQRPACHFVTSSTTASVTAEISDGEISVPYSSDSAPGSRAPSSRARTSTGSCRRTRRSAAGASSPAAARTSRPIARHLDRDLPCSVISVFGARSVARVPPSAPFRLAGLVAQVLGQLALRALAPPAPGQLLQQPLRARSGPRASRTPPAARPIAPCGSSASWCPFLSGKRLPPSTARRLHEIRYRPTSLRGLL